MTRLFHQKKYHYLKNAMCYLHLLLFDLKSNGWGKDVVALIVRLHLRFNNFVKVLEVIKQIRFHFSSEIELHKFRVK